jgi:hypothetical protein
MAAPGCTIVPYPVWSSRLEPIQAPDALKPWMTGIHLGREFGVYWARGTYARARSIALVDLAAVPVPVYTRQSETPRAGMMRLAERLTKSLIR